MGNFSNYWDLHTLFTKIKNKIKSVSDKIDDSVSLKTATGNPITLTDAANANVEELSMTIEPIQDLHGYSKPWPAGGGKNKAHIDSTKIYSTDKNPSDPITGITDGMLIIPAAVNGYIRNEFLTSYTINNSHSITVKMLDISGAHAYGAGIVVEIDDSKTYTLSLKKTGGTVLVGWLNSDGSILTYTGEKTLPCTLTPSSGAKYAMITCCPGRNAEHTYSDIQLEEGTSATTFEPWENICPISGLTSGEVTRVGKNLIEETISNANILATGTIAANSDFDIQIAKVRKGVQYTAKSNDLLVCGFFETKPTIGSISYNASRIADEPLTFTAPIDGYIAFRTAANYATPQLELGSAATDYEAPATPATATITLGQTVYGGSVNFKTGEVNVTHGFITFNGSEPWYTNGNRGAYLNCVDISPNIKAKGELMFSDYVVIDSGDAPASNGYANFNVSGSAIQIHDENGMTSTAYKTYLASHNVQLCYELATPTTLTLTPAELELLKGNNTITANGAEISIEYYPDNAIGTLAGRVDDLDNTTSDMQEQIATKANITDVNAIKNKDLRLSLNDFTNNGARTIYESVLAYIDSLSASDKPIRNISFFITSITNTIPRDLPAAIIRWQYSYGEIIFRHNQYIDATIILYPFSTADDASPFIKHTTNGTEGTWHTVLTDKSLATKYLHYISIQRYNNEAATIDVTIPIINDTATTMTKTEILAYLDEHGQRIKPIYGMYHNIYQGSFILPEPIVDFIYTYYEGSEDKRLIFYRFENDELAVTPTNQYLRIEDRFVVQIMQNA